MNPEFSEEPRGFPENPEFSKISGVSGEPRIFGDPRICLEPKVSVEPRISVEPKSFRQTKERLVARKGLPRSPSSNSVETISRLRLKILTRNFQFFRKYLQEENASYRTRPIPRGQSCLSLLVASSVQDSWLVGLRADWRDPSLTARIPCAARRSARHTRE